MLANDATNIVWMFHTVPAFPENNGKGPTMFSDKKPIPKSGELKGQQYVCFSLPFAEQGKISIVNVTIKLIFFLCFRLEKDYRNISTSRSVCYAL